MTKNAFSKVTDNRNQPIRGLWLRNGKYLARLSVDKRVKWVPLSADTPAQAKSELARLLIERDENTLRHIGKAPSFADYLLEYSARLSTSGKKLDTVELERGHLKRWCLSLGPLALDKIRPAHLTKHLHELKASGLSSRTCNLTLVCLRNLLKAARTDGYIKTLPVDGIPWLRVEKRARPLFTRADLDLICQTALKASKNGQQLSDFIRLLSLAGSREAETLKLKWSAVDFSSELLTIGADADTKNRECRRVDFNPELSSLLRDMASRRAPDSEYLFPSPQRGYNDTRARSFRESLLLTRALLPARLQSFGFHDARHHFISFCVMSGLDFMTIARWVGHKDGGILIGRVYGHLSNAHTRAQAAKVSFNPPQSSQLDRSEAFNPSAAA